MKAYHGDVSLKEKFMERVRKHRELDELHKGAMSGRSDDGTFRGCAVVCTMETYNHAAYETEIGVPRLLSKVGDQFMHWLLVDPEAGVIRHAKSEQTKKAVQDVAALYVKKIAGETVTLEQWEAVRTYTWSRFSAAAGRIYYYQGFYRGTEAYGKARIRQAEKLIELMKAATVIAPA